MKNSFYFITVVQVMEVTIHRKKVTKTELNTGTEINSLIGLYLANLS